VQRNWKEREKTTKGEKRRLTKEKEKGGEGGKVK
jgi:hypothetical protein